MTIVHQPPPGPRPKPVESPGPPTPETIELTIIHGRHGACKHTKVEVDAERRMVACRACNASLDPFDALLTISDNYSHYIDGLEWHKRSVVELEKQKRVLETILSRVKQELKRLGIPLGRAAFRNASELAKMAGIPESLLSEANEIAAAYGTRRKKTKLTSIKGLKP